MRMGWFRKQLRAWGRLPPQQARTGLIGLGAAALLLTVLAAALGVSSELHVVQIELGLGLALAALAVALLLLVPLMAGILMRRWPLEPEIHAATEPMAADVLMTETPAPLSETFSETLFDLELDAADKEGLAAMATMDPPCVRSVEASSTESLWQTALRSAHNSHALGLKIGAHLTSVVQVRQRIAESLAVIDMIACETNALALQAVINTDAADHAWRQPHEPTEVRILAQRAASAAREIHGVVLATEAKIDPVVRQVVASIHTEALVADAQTMLACLDELSKPLASNLSALPPYAAHHPVVRMDSVIERQNSWAHHSACLAEALNAQADRLQKVVSAFKILQQTQEAAWMAQRAIHQARDTARDTARDRAGRKTSRPAL
jgi:hypothetical protein